MHERKDALLVGEMIYFTNSLACVLGDANQAAMLQQVFWWMYQAAKDKTGRIGKFEDGRWWTYQEMSDWRERFSWMSYKTLQRTRKKLEDKGVLLRKDEANPQAPGGVRVWLSVDENRLEQLQDEYLAALENEDDEGSPNVGEAPPKGSPNVGEDLSQPGRTFTNIHKQTDSNIHNGSAAPAADAALAAAPNDAAPLEQKQTPSGQQSYIQSVQGKGPRDRTKEKAGRAADDEGGKGRVNPAELTELGKLIVHLSGKGSRNKVPTKSLTERQARMLDTEVEFFHGDDKITITPNELYDREPKLVRHWLEKIVHPKLYARFAQKQGYTLGREMLIKTLTLEGDQGYEIRDYYRWRESQKHLERLNAESYVPQPDEEAVPQFVDDGPAPAFGPITQEEIDAMFADDEDETERSADNDEQE
jgi:hypothetical protein